MSMAFRRSLSRENAAYGGFADAIGGIATIVLAVLGLAGVRPTLMVAIATVIFGVALLIQVGTMLTEYASTIFPTGANPASSHQFTAGSMSPVFLVGAAGIVLGILALLGIHAVILTPVAVIAYGAALALSSNSVSNLYLIKQAATTTITESETALAGREMLASEMAAGSAGIQVLAGLAAIVLGILAIAGTGVDDVILILVALLALGATLILTGSTLSGTMMSVMRPPARA